ncbi:MAG: FG-GAP-like repeat-containing protein, partial [Myxococcota bacterium]
MVRFQRLLFVAALAAGSAASAQTFTEDGDTFGDYDLGGNKDGGLAFGDLNGDGCIDVLVNTDNGLDSRILVQGLGADGSCDGDFSDVSDAQAEGLTERRRQRSALVADLNSDGALDLVVNTFPNLDIYLSSGGDTPTFGNADQDPSQTFTSWVNDDGTTTGVNTEGMTVADYDGDGDLDLAIESHQFGIRLLENDGTGTFTAVRPADAGLPDDGAQGDYAAAADLNNDGLIDFVMRRPGGTAFNQSDLFFNTGTTPRFTASNEIAEASANGAKGGVAICDFNNDGRLDVFWTPNVLYLQDATPGNFTRTTTWSTTAPPANVRGASCFDADNDGDQDLFLTGNAGGRQLYINRLGDGVTELFTGDNRGIVGGGEGLGSVGLDIDLDGDIDIAVNSDGGNELFIQTALPALQNEYLAVMALRENPDGSTRPDPGTTARLESCGGVPFGPRLSMDAGGGRGSMNAGPMHFGLNGLSSAPVVVALRFANSSEDVRVAVQADQLGDYRRLVVLEGASSDLNACPDADGDMIPDAQDADSDGDGIIDASELGSDLSGDSDLDGVPDWADPDSVVCTDVAAPLDRCDELPVAVDVDQDGLPNHLDLDSDGDGLFDTIESGAGLDANFDGLPDDTTDTDGDGLIDDADASPADPAAFAMLVMATSTDAVAPDYLDRDSDGDGITDSLEAGLADADGDGVPDACVSVDVRGRCSAGSLATAPPATDGGDPDYLDLDSDGDGLLDSVEAFDADGSGGLNGAEVGEAGADADGDGIDDAFDPDGGGAPITAPFATFRDEDGDGTPDWLESCGDAYVRGSEACDDGNTVDGDACSNACLLGIGIGCTGDDRCDSNLCDADGTCQICDDTLVGMGIDQGCSAGAAACVKTAGVSTCALCDDDTLAMDQGCMGATPVCSTSGAALVCVECGVDSDCGGDEVCSAEGVCIGCDSDDDCEGGEVCDTAATTCVICLDSPGTPDSGCTDAALPFCARTSGAGTAGTSCVECLVDGDCPGAETCGATNICEGGCMTDADCPGSDVCDAASMTCVVCLDSDGTPDSGCDDAMLPICAGAGPGTPGTSCVECLGDGDCATGVCDEAANSCITCADTSDGI